MRVPFKTLQAVVLLFISLDGFAHSKMTCESFLNDSGLTQTHSYRSLKKEIRSEFDDLTLSPADMRELHILVNKDGPITDASRAAFNQLAGKLMYINRAQHQEASQLLGREISLDEATALKLARVLGRTERGENKQLLAFWGNYTQEQIHRKDRILELAGFSMEERLMLFNSKLVEEVLTEYTAENLFFDQKMMPNKKQAKPMNDEALRQSYEESLVRIPTDRQQSLSRSEVEPLFERVARNPIVRLMKQKKYDPDGDIGFCFGRKFVAYLETLILGVHKSALRNVFVVGNIGAIESKQTWKYHTALMVKATEGGWWVIDPLLGRVVTLEEWYQRNNANDLKGDLRLYITNASRMGAGSSYPYTKVELASDEYNNYFTDVLKYFKLRSRNEAPKKPIWMAITDFVLKLLHSGI
jgi:hypothetical protein